MLHPSLIGASLETGEENDNICYGRCGWTIGESKVSDCKLQGFWVCIVIHASAEYIVHFKVKGIARLSLYVLCTFVTFLRLMILNSRLLYHLLN